MTPLESFSDEMIVDAVVAGDTKILASIGLDKLGCRWTGVRLNGNRPNMFDPPGYGSGSIGNFWFRWNSRPCLYKFSLIPENCVCVTWVPTDSAAASHYSVYMARPGCDRVPVRYGAEQPILIMKPSSPITPSLELGRFIWQWLIINDAVVWYDSVTEAQKGLALGDFFPEDPRFLPTELMQTLRMDPSVVLRVD